MGVASKCGQWVWSGLTCHIVQQTMWAAMQRTITVALTDGSNAEFSVSLCAVEEFNHHHTYSTCVHIIDTFSVHTYVSVPSSVEPIVCEKCNDNGAAVAWKLTLTTMLLHSLVHCRRVHVFLLCAYALYFM